MRKIAFKITGQLEIHASHRKIELSGRYVRALFLLLVASNGRVTRDAIIEYLWDADPEENSNRVKLRQLLFRMRKQFDKVGLSGSLLIKADRSALWLNSELYESDYAEILKLRALSDNTTDERILSLYHGNIFENEPPVSINFDTWLEALNSQIKEEMVSICRTLLESYQRDGISRSVERIAQKLTQINAPHLSQYHLPEPAVHKLQQLEDFPLTTIGSVATTLERGEVMRGKKEYLKQFSPKEFGNKLVEVGPLTTSMLIIRIVEVIEPEAQFRSYEGEDAAHNRLVHMVETCVYALEGKLSTNGETEFLAEFNSPIGAETTPLRAVYTAKRIVTELKHLFPSGALCTAYGYRLAFAIATRSDDVDNILEAKSNTFHISKQAVERIIDFSPTGGIVICSQTREIVQSIFNTEQLPQVDGLNIYELLDRLPRPRHFEIRVEKGLSPFIGRSSEKAFLETKWLDVSNGDTLVGVLSGVLGSGKSRLTYELVRHVSKNGGSFSQFEGNYIYRNTAFYPVRCVLEDMIGLKPQWSVARRKDVLINALEKMGARALDFAEAIQAVLDIDIVQTQGRRFANQKIDSQLTRLFMLLFGETDIAIIVEDTEWIDSRTADFLKHAADYPSTQGRLILYTYGTSDREIELPEFINFHLSLGPLSQKQTVGLINQIDKDARLGIADHMAIIEASRSLPLYIEELTQAKISSIDQETLSNEPLPNRVWEHSRDLFSVEDVSKSPQHCAALFETVFSIDLLAIVCDIPNKEVSALFDTLTERGLLRRVLKSNHHLFEFRTPLIKKSFKSQIPEQDRIAIYIRIAEAFGENPVVENLWGLDIIADLWLKAGKLERAIPMFIRAAQKANALGSYTDAEAILNTAVSALDGVEQTPSLKNLEIEAYLELASTISRNKSIASNEAQSAWQRASALSTESDDAKINFRTLWGQWSISIGQRELQKAGYFSEQISREARRLNSPEHTLEADHCKWTTRHLTGDLAIAERCIVRGLEMASVGGHNSLAENYGGHDPSVCCRSVGAIVSQLLSNDDEAKRRSLEAISLAMKLNHSGSIAHALLGTLDVAVLRNRPEQILRNARWLTDLAEQERYFDFKNIATLMRCWAVMQIKPEEGTLQQMRQALKARTETGSIGMPFHSWLLSDAEMKMGNTQSALELIQSAKELAQSSREIWWLPKLFLIEGDLLAKGDARQVKRGEESIRSGLSLARRQGAKYFLDQPSNQDEMGVVPAE